MKMRLTPRLMAIAELCHTSKKIIDVGCDHAKLPIYLVQNGIIDSAIATDIKEGPIKSAKRNIEAQGVGERVKTNLCFGLRDFNACSADTIIIAGMGADEIMAILDDAKWTKSTEHKIIIQPMTGAPRVRRYLAKNGYAIKREIVARETGKMYTIMLAQWAQSEIKEENYFLFSDALMAEKNGIEYINNLHSRHKNILWGMSRGANADEKMQYQSKIVEFLHNTLTEMTQR